MHALPIGIYCRRLEHANAFHHTLVPFGPIVNFQFLLSLLFLPPNRSIGNKPGVVLSQQSNRINLVHSPVHIIFNRDTTDTPK